jgi:hypothetical protein
LAVLLDAFARMVARLTGQQEIFEKYDQETVELPDSCSIFNSSSAKAGNR